MIKIQTKRYHFMLNATWIETFTVLAEEGHFTRAAQRLNMTQPGVSQHLRKLERQVGQPLIAQDGKSFTLTAAGEALRDLGLSRRVQERHLQDALTRDDPEKGTLSIACSGSFAMLYYPRAIAMMRAAPGLTIHVEAAPQRRVLAGILEGEFDLGLMGRDPGHPRIEAVHLGREELCLLLPQHADTPRSLKDLEALGLVSHPDAGGYADDLLAKNFPEDYAGADRLKVRTTVNQIGQIPAPVAEGVGYTLLPRSGLAAFTEADRVRVAQLSVQRHLDLWAISRRGRVPSARAKAAMAVFREIAKDLA
jgi:DNA-binding transcriptional LysR family regulator